MKRAHILLAIKLFQCLSRNSLTITSIGSIDIGPKRASGDSSNRRWLLINK